MNSVSIQLVLQENDNGDEQLVLYCQGQQYPTGIIGTNRVAVMLHLVDAINEAADTVPPAPQEEPTP